MKNRAAWVTVINDVAGWWLKQPSWNVVSLPSGNDIHRLPIFSAMALVEIVDLAIDSMVDLSIVM